MLTDGTAGSTDNIEAVACAVCAKMLAGDDTGEEKLAAEVEMYWHIVARNWEAVTSPPFDCPHLRVSVGPERRGTCAGVDSNGGEAARAPSRRPASPRFDRRSALGGLEPTAGRHAARGGTAVSWSEERSPDRRRRPVGRHGCGRARRRRGRPGRRREAAGEAPSKGVRGHCCPRNAR